MAFFTIRLKDICERYSDKDAPTKEKILNAIPHIFDDSWETVPEDYKTTLCYKILRHYYMREICFETPDRWIMALNDEMALIMPRYNVLYSSLELLKQKGLFNNVDYTEELTQTDTGTTASETTGENKDTSNTTSNTTQSNTNKTTGTATGNGETDAWQTSQDTPQGALTNVANESYLSSAVHNKSTNNTDTTTASNGESTGTTKTTGTATSSGTNKGTSKTDATNTTEYLKRYIGKTRGADFIDLFNKSVSAIISIDEEIIRELSPMFFSLYE